jgi:hypothetical protein
LLKYEGRAAEAGVPSTRQNKKQLQWKLLAENRKPRPIEETQNQ